MELHHIDESAAGGANTYENCIPLCFDCHADMKSYDHKHPKGTKYTPNELKIHRDRWYAKVSESGAYQGSANHRDLDQSSFERLQKLLPWSPSMKWLKEFPFTMPFDRTKLDPFHDFDQERTDPSFEFIDADLERQLCNLKKVVREFLVAVAGNTFPVQGVAELNEVPSEWQDDAPDRYDETVRLLGGHADKVCNDYDSLVRTARRKLGAAS